MRENTLMEKMFRVENAREDSNPVERRGILQVEELKAWYDKTLAVKGVNMTIHSRAITAIIGPSGCGKSTLIRCLNRMHEVSPGARAEGSVELDGINIYGEGVDPVQVRRVVGMVFQKPNPFPMMTIYDNVVAGLLLQGRTHGR